MFGRPSRVRLRRGTPLALAVAALTTGLLLIPPARADLPPEGEPRETFSAGDLAEVALLPQNGPGQNLTILLPEEGTVDPRDGYPATDPAGAVSETAFAGIILAERRPVVPGSDPLQLYCVQVHIETSTGVGYVNRPWADVGNLGYVAQTLANYFPSTSEPASLASDNQRAAAVQAAIWFFTDGAVVPTTNPAIRNATAAIVAEVLALGPLDEPPRPTISITPATASAPIGAVAGPFTVDANGPITLTAEGGQLFADAAGTVPLPTPARLASGSQFFVRSDDTSGVSLSVRGEATVFRGNQYFYDGGDPDLDDAQRLILAQTGVADAVATAQVAFFDTATLAVTKRLEGPAAGRQDEVRVDVTCDTTSFDPLVIPAGATEPVTQMFTGIPTPATCTIAETADGSNATAQVQVENGEQTVVLEANTSPDDVVEAEPIVDTYTFAPTTTTSTTTAPTTAPGDPGAPGGEGAPGDPAAPGGEGRTGGALPTTGARGPGGASGMALAGGLLVAAGVALLAGGRIARRRRTTGA